MAAKSLPLAHSNQTPTLGQLWPWMLASVLLIVLAVMLRNLAIGV
ncbi:hypothetical protein BH11PLA2_BH11PLA2_36060 [soil metagenome]